MGWLTTAGLGGSMAMRRVPILVVAVTLAWSSVTFARPGDSDASIAGSVSDSCRNFESTSTKDISHVEIHYADGRVIKDESNRTHNFSFDGSAGDEIDYAIVKSGTTNEQFPCQGDRMPVALMEINTPSNCFTAV